MADKSEPAFPNVLLGYPVIERLTTAQAQTQKPRD